MNNNQNVLSSDKSLNTKASELQDTVFAMSILKSMWGLAMFGQGVPGQASVLGAGFTSNYVNGVQNVSYKQATLNVIGS